MGFVDTNKHVNSLVKESDRKIMIEHNRKYVNAIKGSIANSEGDSVHSKSSRVFG